MGNLIGQVVTDFSGLHHFGTSLNDEVPFCLFTFLSHIHCKAKNGDSQRFLDELLAFFFEENGYFLVIATIEIQ